MTRSILAPDGALVPVAQRQMRDPACQKEYRDSGERDEKKRREHARDLEPVTGFENTVGEPRCTAAGAGDEFSNHSADQREPAGNFQAAEKIRQRGGQAQMAQCLPSARPVELEQVDKVMVG